MAAAGAEIGDAQPVNRPQLFDLFPQLGHGTGIEHLQFKPPHILQHGPGPQFHQHRQCRNFPHHHFGPLALKRQVKLAALLFQMIGRQLQMLKPLDEIGAEHLAFAVKGVAAQKGAFAAAEPQGADMVQLLAQFTLINQIGKADRQVAVYQAEPHQRVRPIAENRLAHQELVEIGVDQRPHNRVDLPFVVIDPGGDIDHLALHRHTGT